MQKRSPHLPASFGARAVILFLRVAAYLISITNGGSVFVTNSASGYSVKVGPSGTLSGNGTLYTTSSTVPLTDVKCTLSPNSTLTIDGDLTLEGSATTVCNVTPENSSRIDVSVSGTATLNGRLLVNMTGTFAAGTTYTLLYANTAISGTFSSVSITYSPVPAYTPVITYDAHHVYLYLRPN